MKAVTVSRVAVEAKLLKRRQPTTADFDQVLDEPCQLYEGDELRAVSMRFDAPQLRDLESVVQSIPTSSSYRTVGMKQRSRAFGFQPRNAIRKDWCYQSSLSTEDPAAHRMIEQCGQWMSERYAEFAGDVFKQHEQAMARVLPEWRMLGSVYTSGIINENNALAYHFDSGNFRNCWSGMIVLPHRITGGELVLPQFRVAFRFNEPSVFFFDGQSILHGVMPIRRPSMGYRYSLVYYSLLQMWRCLPADEELLRAKEVRTVTERRRVLYAKGLATPQTVGKMK